MYMFDLVQDLKQKNLKIRVKKWKQKKKIINKHMHGYIMNLNKKIETKSPFEMSLFASTYLIFSFFFLYYL